jgi:hypothetical protein
MKDKILGWLFKGYIKQLKESSQDEVKLQIEAYRATLDVRDIVRAKLKGVRPNHPYDDTILQNHLSSLDDATRLVFLSHAHEVVENETYKKVVLSLIVQSEHDAIMNAKDIVEVNFSRATINGLILIEDELLILDKMYREEEAMRKVLTEEERLSAI